MRVMLVHPSALSYSAVFLRLEPPGLERVAGAAREAGHEIRAVDLRVSGRERLGREARSFRPKALGMSLKPPERFHEEPVRTRAVIDRGHPGLGRAFGAPCVLPGNLPRGQTNFARMLWRFNQVCNPRRRLSVHTRGATQVAPTHRTTD